MDQNTYHFAELDNDMRVLLIGSPKVEYTRGMINVDTGIYDDPKDF